jgi:tetratricopeptide (TPR) repeat protein
MTTRTPPYWLITIYGGLAVGCLSALARGVSAGIETLALGGGLGLVVVLASAPVAALVRRSAQAASEAGERAAALTGEIRRLSEQAALSDDARRVLNRSRERELLRRAIEEDIARQDYDAAMVLVRELAERFGYRADAEEFRARIETARFETIDQTVAEGVRAVDALITQRKWTSAIAEAARLTRVYPESDRVAGLRHRVEAARDRYKQDLERGFLQRAQAGDVDEAFELLREMDGYLTEQEAEPFRELAKGVIGRARENLGVQFKLAVQDRRWQDAAIVGDRVVREFPNTRMAAEIRGMIDEIRQRAAVGS